MNTKGKLAIMSAKATVYFGPSTNYVASGSIASGEYCVIISCERPFGSSAKWCQIEYISGSSRKRGLEQFLPFLELRPFMAMQ